MTFLHNATAGTWIKIVTLPLDVIGARFVRLGITPGCKVQCIERLPGGTIVIQKNRQQVAIGHALAEQIAVVIISNTGEEVAE